MAFSTIANPTTADNKVIIGSGTGVYAQLISALTPATTYHVRAFSTNAKGISYGGDSIFTTLSNTPLSGLKIYEGFSPNDDNINDTWVIENPQEIAGHEIVIYNIFGQEVFHHTGYDTPWDGKKDGQVLPAAEYYYMIRGANYNVKGAVVLFAK